MNIYTTTSHKKIKIRQNAGDDDHFFNEFEIIIKLYYFCEIYR